MEKPFHPISDVAVLSVNFPILDIGVLPINAFVLKAKEPVLIDTGLVNESDAFMKALESVMNPKDLRWIWLTHDDLDHTGSLQRVLEAAPKARLVCNPVAPIRLSTAWRVPLSRVNFINPGDSLSVGDRKLTAVRPPVFDNPMSTGFYDDKTKAYFSVDAFGAIMPGGAQSAWDYAEDQLAQGMMGWATADNPWVHLVDHKKFGQSLESIRKMDPSMVFSSHLPPAKGKLDRLLKVLSEAPAATPFAGPPQAALEGFIAKLKETGKPVPYEA
jgi:flavorubredoxin